MMNDKYSHNDPNIMYITESLPGPNEYTLESETITGNFNSQLLYNCSCDEICDKTSCTCLQILQGRNYDRYKDADGKLRHILHHKGEISSDYHIFECSTNCSCPPNCGNRIVQNGPLEGLMVRPCIDEFKGLGLFTTQFIYKGTFVCEYAGEIITKSQALKRSQKNEEQGKMNYIFCLNEHSREGLLQTFVDPSKFGNIGRYMNHSCEPNCFIVPARFDIAIPRLAIFACSDIPAGDELTFSYAGSVPGPRNADKKYKKKCLCKSSSCQGYMPFDDF